MGEGNMCIYVAEGEGGVRGQGVWKKTYNSLLF